MPVRILLKSFFRKHTVPFDEYIEQAGVTDLHHYELLEAVISLPEKYRRVVYLHYYEGYTAPEISEILRVKDTHLARGKDLLRDVLGGEV